VGLADTAEAVGKGLVAGVIGTAVMTVSSSLEAKLRGRGASTAPADAAGKVLGVQPRDERGEARFSNVVHWSYGTSWGGVRGLLDAAGMDGARATGVHFAALWGGEQVMLPALGVAPPLWESAPKEIGIDALHHAVYVLATAVAFAALERSAP